MRKALSFAFAFILCTLCIYTSPAVIAADDIWDGTIATSFEYGSGSESDPYIISNGAELAYFANLINSGNSEASYYKLVADIKLNRSEGSYWTNSAKVWTPIGTSSNAFNGVFDGNHHTISGIYIENGNDYQSLFGANNGIVKNLRVVESSIEGENAIGGIVALNRGTVSGCSFDGSVKAYRQAGGIVGFNDEKAIVESCRNKGRVEVYDKDSIAYGMIVGGIIGSNYGIIENCYNSGSLYCDRFVGGIAGECLVSASGSIGKISNCYNIGVLSCKINGEAGGITAKVASIPENHLRDCFYSSGTAMKGVHGYDNLQNVVTAYNVYQMSGMANYYGFDFDEIWTTQSSTGYPELRILQETSEPFTPPVKPPVDDSSDAKNESLNIGADIPEDALNATPSNEDSGLSSVILVCGLILGCLILLAVIIIIVIVLVKTNKKPKKAKNKTVVPPPSDDIYSQAIGGDATLNEVKCNTCGSSIPGGLDYCPKCGMPVMNISSPIHTPPASSPSPTFEQPANVNTPVYEAPKPSFEPENTAPAFAPVYEEPKPSFEPETTSLGFTPVYEAPKPTFEPETTSLGFTPVYEEPKPTFEPEVSDPTVDLSYDYERTVNLSKASSFDPALTMDLSYASSLAPEWSSAPTVALGGNTQICANCGNIIESDCKFCAHCGSPASVPEAPQAKFCPTCGNKLESNSKFCAHCGSKV